jgi:hypothetical protein
MRRTLVWVIVAGVLIAGCGGDSDSSNGGDSGGSESSSEPSAGDSQYLDPFQDDDRCLSTGEIQQKIDRIAAQVQNPERKQKAIHAVRDRGC